MPDRVFNLTAGQPFYTQVVCQAVIDRLNESRKYEVDLEDLDRVVGEIIENPLPQMIFSWNALTNLEKLGLSAIAEIHKNGIRPVVADDIIRYVHEHRISYRLNRAELMRDLESLFTHDVLDKDPMTEGYTFKMDLWRLWITRMHSIWQVVREIGARPLGAMLRRRILAVAAMAGVLAGTVYFAIRFLTPAPFVPAYLSVRTEPAAADILLDGKLVGRGVLSSLEVPAGVHLIEVSLDGYSRVSEDVTLIAGDSTDLGDIVLEELTGLLALDSEPQGAAITIDGKSTERVTPWEFKNLTVRHCATARQLPGRHSRCHRGQTGFADTEECCSETKAREPLDKITSNRGRDLCGRCGHIAGDAACAITGLRPPPDRSPGGWLLGLFNRCNG